MTDGREPVRLARFFDPDNMVFRPLGVLADLLILSLLWLLCCLPVFTLGPATAALYDAAVKCVRGGENNPYGRFFHAFKLNFKVGALSTLVVLALGLICFLVNGILRTLAQAGGAWYAAYAAWLVFLLLPLGAACYLFPALSRFTMGVGGLFSSCARLAVAHLPSTVIMAVAVCASVWVSSWLIFPAFFLPTVVALFQSLLLERIFKPFQ